MRQLSLRKIAEVCGGTYHGPQELLDREIEGVVTDSRQVEQDFMYVAMRGERVDGHKFIPSVYEKGALVSLSEETLENPAGPYIQVESCLKAMQTLAAFYRSVLDIRVVGITGSVGKTSTKEMIAAVLSQKYKVLKTAGNFNNELGLPLTIFRIREEHEIAVLEMGISGFGEMDVLAKMAKPDVCVITNIGICHLENLINRDGILQEKSHISDYTNGTVVYNGNDDKLSGVEEVNGMKPIRYFVEDGSAERKNPEYLVYADNILDRGLRGLDADLHFPEETLRIHEPIPGMHQVYNACAAACVGRTLGLTNAEIVAGIASAKTIAGRTNLIDLGDILLIDDCYNANPVSMRAALDVLEGADGRKIAVLGDMGELGVDEKELHYGVGEYAAQKNIDVIFCAGPLCEELARAARKGCEVHHFATRELLTEALLPFVKEGDTVLVKASHFMGYPEILKALRNR